MRAELHTHTTQSDGELIPIEMIRRALAHGAGAIAITDHCSLSDVESIVRRTVMECEIASRNWNIIAIPGVEITHVPAAEIPRVVRMAREAGAVLVNLHGETPVEPVEPGTNRAGIEGGIDVLCHPGFLDEETARLAAEKGIFIELTSRKGHSLTNGHVATVATRAGCKLLVNSDAHCSGDLISVDFALKVARGCGLDPDLAGRAVGEWPLEIIGRV